MYAANLVSGFPRIVQVLNTSTSASSRERASPSPRSSSKPLIRSESCAFIWQPKVVTKYRRCTRQRVLAPGPVIAAAVFCRFRLRERKQDAVEAERADWCQSIEA